MVADQAAVVARAPSSDSTRRSRRTEQGERALQEHRFRELGVTRVIGEGTRQRSLGFGLFVAEPAQPAEDLFADIGLRGGGGGERSAIGAAVGVANLERGRRA